MKGYLLRLAYWLKSVGLAESNSIMFMLGEKLYKTFRKDLYFD